MQARHTVHRDDICYQVPNPCMPIRMSQLKVHVAYIELQQDSPCLLPCKHVICVWSKKSRLTVIADM